MVALREEREETKQLLEEARSGGAISQLRVELERMDGEMDTLRTRMSREEVDVVRLWGEKDVALQLLEPTGFA